MGRGWGRRRGAQGVLGLLVSMLGITAGPPVFATITTVDSHVSGPFAVNAGDTLNLVAEGSITTSALPNGPFVNCAVTVNSGGTLNIAGGSVIDNAQGMGVAVYGGTVNMSSGSVVAANRGLYVNGGTVHISGGSITAGPNAYGIEVFGNSGVTISGGSVATVGEGYGLVVLGGGTAMISGGTYSGSHTMAISGRTTIYGCNLQRFGGDFDGVLTGILQDGTPINTVVSVGGPDLLILQNAVPQITCPTPLSAPTDSGQCTATLAPGLALATTCTVPSAVVGLRDDDEALLAPYPVGRTTITWTTTDELGQSASCQQVVTVFDIEKPTITSPADVLVSTDPGQCTAIIHYAPPPVGDNCVGAIVSSNLPSGSRFPLGTTLVTWSARDAAGNQATAIQKVTVKDTEAPLLTCPANITKLRDKGKNTATVAIKAPPATDNCGTAAVVGTRSDGNPLSNPYPQGRTTIRWTATDPAGNQTACTQTVTVTK